MTFAPLTRRLFEPVDIAALVFFRMAFGAIMLWEVCRYFAYGWIARYWIDPPLAFTYYGFGWVRPWPGIGMYVHWAALGVLAIAIIAGYRYRISATLFFLGFTYAFLLEQARYLNHFYLICLISFLLIFIPAHRAVSLDVRRTPSLRSDTAPAWALWLLRAQIGIAYCFAGIAKLNGDWLRGEPLRAWLADRTDFPLIGALFTEEWVVHIANWGSLLFDLLVVPLLLWRPTRAAAFAGAVLFSLMNARLFDIGVFPWLMIAATTLFLPPEWPRRLFPPRAATPVAPPRRQRLILALVSAYLVVQLLVPLRHLLYPGDVNWTEEGHRFSWHMKLRHKEARLDFTVTDSRTGDVWTVDPGDFLPAWQARKMATRPDMILQFSHYLADDFRRHGHAQVSVRANALASLNGRRPQRLIDPAVDLARERRSLRAASWTVPLDTRARPGEQWGGADVSWDVP